MEQKMTQTFLHSEIKPCLFCNLSSDQVIKQNELCFVIYDKFPVTPHHSLVIPKRHCATFFDLTHGEIEASLQLIHEMKVEIESKDPTVSGFSPH